MNRVVATDYVLDVLCDHTVNPLPDPVPPRTVARLYYLPRPVDEDGRTTFGFLEWREALIDSDPDYPPAMQTYYGEAQRIHGGMPAGVAPADMVPDRNGGPGMAEGQRWRFWCADCEDTLPVRHSRLVPVLVGLRAHGVPRITLTALRRRVAPAGHGPEGANLP